MPNTFIADFHIEVVFAPPIALPLFAQRIPALNVAGVYFLREGSCELTEFDPLSSEVVYIGKANGETIFSRCKKHLQTVQDARDRNGKPKTRPGERFKAYRQSIRFDPARIYVIPGLMSAESPYLVSCAEEYFLYQYAERHGDLPPANTKE